MHMHTGIEVIIDGRVRVIKAILLASTCDLPAKAAVLNFVQHNGFYGCSQCEQKGKLKGML